jgi:hypothetical protein
MTDQELKRLVKKWQKLLRVQDWKVTASFVSLKQSGDGRVGQVNIYSGGFYAEVEIDPFVLKRKDAEKQIEETVAHELAHIQVNQVFAPVGAIFNSASNDQKALLEVVLAQCEEEQVRNIEFLCSKFIGR